MSYNIPLDTSGDVDFEGTINADFFTGDGSGLTNLPSSNPFDQNLNTTDSPSFVDGDFSGTLSAVTVAAHTNNLTLQSNSGNALLSVADSGSISITAHGSIYQQFSTTGVGYRQNCFPIFSTLDMGSAATPWNNGYFNNLSSAVGGTQRVYGLGTDGDTDTEYIETSWDGTTAKIQTKETGTGVLRKLDVLAGVTGMKAYANSTLILTSAWSSVWLNNVQVMLYAPSGGYVSVRNGDLRPYDAVTPINCGQAAVPWANVYSVDGNFSGTVTTDTINASGATLDLQLGGSSVLKANSSFSYYYAGGGNTYILQGSDFLRPQGGAAPFDLGGTSHRWRTIFGEDGSFSGTVTCNESFLINRTWNDASTVFQGFDANITDTASDSNSNLLNLKVSGVQKFRVKKDGAVTATSFTGDGSGLTNLPASNPFDQNLNTTDSPSFADGSFSGDVVFEDGSTVKKYNLGSSGDVDSEYLEINGGTNIYSIYSKATGTGVVRELTVGNDDNRFRFLSSGVLCSINSVTRLNIGANFTYLSSAVAILPGSDGTIELGRTTARWENVATVDIDASGDVVMAANVDFTGLPTSDPSVTGRLWSDSGTLKISAGGSPPP